MATTAEKSKDVLDDLVKKGELTVEQGKALNQELKHNVKKAVKDSVTVKSKVPEGEDEIADLIQKMTPEQIAIMKAQLEKAESAMGGSEDEEDDLDLEEAILEEADKEDGASEDVTNE